MVQMKSALGGIPVVRAMVRDFRTLNEHSTLGEAIEEFLAGSQQDFPVMEGDHVVGILTRGDLLAGLAQHGRDARVADAMQKNFITVDAGEMLETALSRLQSCECRTLPVLQRGQLLGLVTMDNVGEFIAIHSAIDAARQRR
jgi:predicted transcriptional regulator